AGGGGVARQGDAHHRVVVGPTGQTRDQAHTEALGDQGRARLPLVAVVRDLRGEAGTGAGGHDQLVVGGAGPGNDPGFGSSRGQGDLGKSRQRVIQGYQQVQGVVDEVSLFETWVGRGGGRGGHHHDG